MRAETDLRLRIDLLEGQATSLARTLTKAIKDRNDAAFAEYSERLASNRARIEELSWVLGEKYRQGILDVQIPGTKAGISVRQAIDMLKTGEIRMEELPPDAQAMVRKGAMEIKRSTSTEY